MSGIKNSEYYRRTTVCIDSYEGRVPTGRMYNQYLPEGKEFHGVIQFLLEMENMFDKTDFPEEFTESRRFKTPSELKTTLLENGQKKGAISTFTVRILFRQHSSWQGSVLWHEGKQEQFFRSVLELILMMEKALSHGNKT